MNTLKLILMIPISWFVFAIVSVVGFTYSTIKHVFFMQDYSFSKQFTPILKALLLIPDGFANAAGGEMFTDVCLKFRKNGELYKGAVRYGKWYMTISAVTGANEKRGRLTRTGKRLTALLSATLGPNHSIEAMRDDIIYK